MHYLRPQVEQTFLDTYNCRFDKQTIDCLDLVIKQVLIDHKKETGSDDMTKDEFFTQVSYRLNEASHEFIYKDGVIVYVFKKIDELEKWLCD